MELLKQINDEEFSHDLKDITILDPENEEKINVELYKDLKATKEKLGMVIPGSGFKITEDGVLSTDVVEKIPVATEYTLGGILSGENLIIDPDLKKGKITDNSHTMFSEKVTDLQDALDEKADIDHIHDISTETNDGFMSKDDFIKLSKIEDNANKFILEPIHLQEQKMGGIIVGNNLSIDDDGFLSIDSSSQEVSKIIIYISKERTGEISKDNTRIDIIDKETQFKDTLIINKFIYTYNIKKLGTYIIKVYKTEEESSDFLEEEIEIIDGKENKLYFDFTDGIYGVEWDGNENSKWLRIDSSSTFNDPIPYTLNSVNYNSDFDSILPWAGMIKEYTSEQGYLVAIPKFYFKWTQINEKGIRLEISSKQFEGSFVSPAHADRGDGIERDIVYVGRYPCDNEFKSMTNKNPFTNISRRQFRENIHTLSQDTYQWDIAMVWTIRMLYLVEYADWDSQECISYGCGNGSFIEKTGSTDKMPYHTGIMYTDKNKYGVAMQYRNIEGLWSNVKNYVDGISIVDDKMYPIKRLTEFSDFYVGETEFNKFITGYQVGMKVLNKPGFEYMLEPIISETGEDNKFITDKTFVRHLDLSPYYTLCIGADCYDQSREYGLFYERIDSIFQLNNLTSSRLMVLPSI